MAGRLWAYIPEYCDGDFCANDCDYCSKAHQNEERMAEEDAEELGYPEMEY